MSCPGLRPPWDPRACSGPLAELDAPRAALAANSTPRGFTSALRDEGRSQVQSGTFTHGGAAHNRE
eukprot:8949505-Pyramimonas_sp.AAC.1